MGSSHSLQTQKQEASSSFTRQKHISEPVSSFATQDYSARPSHISHSLAKIPIANPMPATIETRESGTGLPHALKRNIENLSGLSLNDVQVHYNSPKPTLARALAYTQGNEIYLGPKQERHLAHEAWHAVQQKQGRVRPTLLMRDVKVNDDKALEREADVMGGKANARMNVRQVATTGQKLEAVRGMISPSEQVQQSKASFGVHYNSSKPSAVHALAYTQGTRNSVQPIQMVRIQNSMNGDFYEDTDDMTPLERRGLALQLYQLHNIGGLQQLRDAHPTEDFSDGLLLELMNPTQQEEIIEDDEPKKDTKKKRKRKASGTKTPKRPRTRKLHNLSEGESENEDPSIVWRSLREDENPWEEGLRPPEKHDPSISASAHITAGSRAKEKSAWVSATRSRKVAGSWASVTDKRVAKLKIPEELRAQTVNLGKENGVSKMVYDLTNSEQAKEVFPSGSGSSLNTAKASQEVVIHGGLGPESVQSVFEARKISVKDYNKLKEDMDKNKNGKVIYQGKPVYALFRSRTETTKKPDPRVLLEIPEKEDSDSE